jgi:hypothetical protein
LKAAVFDSGPSLLLASSVKICLDTVCKESTPSQREPRDVCKGPKASEAASDGRGFDRKGRKMGSELLNDLELWEVTDIDGRLSAADLRDQPL